MTATEILNDLLENSARNDNNIDLLKKIITTTYFGQLRVNSLLPDKQFSLADYLVDDQSIIIDFKMLTESKRKQFLDWLLQSHQDEKKHVFLHRQGTNTSRGYLAEVKLNWWGKFKSWLFNEHFEQWELDEINLLKEQQLTGVTIRQDNKGLIVSFSQFGIGQLFFNRNHGKYSDPEQLVSSPDGNTKRVVLNHVLVDRIMNEGIDDFDFSAACENPHPMAVDIKDIKARYQQMYEYRVMEHLNPSRPWYLRLVDWLMKSIRSLFHNEFVPDQQKKNNISNITKPRLLIGNSEYSLGESNNNQDENKAEIEHQKCSNPEHSRLSISYRKDKGDFVVNELRPADNPMLVFCGGGPKIYAHVGVMKALHEASIKPVRFAGSSAGAIMALLCYMGYSAKEIETLLEPIKKEHLAKLRMNKEGLSESNRLETMLDYAICKKVLEIVEKNNLPYPEGKITFAYLEELRQKFPACGIGEELVVTATNKDDGSTRYFSYHKTPNISVSKAVCASASLPVLFMPKQLSDGNKYTDGGLSSNFPIEVFLHGAIRDKQYTLLSSTSGVRPEVIGVQFDYGNEQNLLYKFKEKVYRESWLFNFILWLLTGVKDPASNWVADRFKLKENPLQSIVVKADTDSYFNPTDKEKLELINSGKESAESYIEARYHAELHKNVEIMLESFNSLDELLIHCCNRGHYYWFDKIRQMIIEMDENDEIFEIQSKNHLMGRANELEKIYFPPFNELEEVSSVELESAEEEELIDESQQNDIKQTVSAFLAIYPLMLHLNPNWFPKNISESVINDLRDAIHIDDPFLCLTVLENIEAPHHFLIAAMKHVLAYAVEFEIDPKELQLMLGKLEWIFINANFSHEMFLQDWNKAELNHNQLINLIKDSDRTDIIDRFKEIVKEQWCKPVFKEKPSPDASHSESNHPDSEHASSGRWQFFKKLTKSAESEDEHDPRLIL